MDIVFRVDASLTLGTGHVMRCLALADRLRLRGGSCYFVCREWAGDLCEVIESKGYEAIRLSALGGSAAAVALSRVDSWREINWREDALKTCEALGRENIRPALLVVDNYALGAEWEAAMRSSVGRIFVIDDLADRPHECDILLDQNLHDFSAARYRGLTKAYTRLFLGPRYALLRREFDELASRLRHQGLRRLLVFLGGTDPSNETSKVLTALRLLGSAAPASTLVLGPAHPRANEIQKAAEDCLSVTLVRATDQMGTLMLAADLAIGTCGSTAWERCAVGLPALVAIDADNQRDDARILAERGAVRCLGDVRDVRVETWVRELQMLQSNPTDLMEMSRAAAAVMDGRLEAARELEEALWTIVVQGRVDRGGLS